MALFNEAQNRKPGFKLALVATLIAAIVVGLGAFTRLKHAGLGCPDWPGCYGHMFWPDEGHEIAKANAEFPDAPVQVQKTKPEMVHRWVAAFGLGTSTIALLVMAFIYRHRPSQPLKLPAFIFLFVLLQGAFGKWTVTLKLWPQVVTAHLLGGFTMLSLLWLLTLRLNNQNWRLQDRDLVRVIALRPWVILGLIVVVLQISLGGWTTSNYAALACPDFPTCQTHWLPEMNLADGFNIFQHIGPNYLGGIMDSAARVAIHFSHRIGALITALYVIALALRLFLLGIEETRRMALVLVAILIAQLALGISNVVFGFPLAVAVAHNLCGALLLLAFVTLTHRAFTAQPR